MRAGLLDRRITIERRETTQDDFGEEIEDWVTHKTVWAGIMPVRGREFHEAQAVNAETSVRFRIRYFAGLTEAMRIRDEDDQVYDIDAVLHVGHAKRELEVMARLTNAESAV